MLPIFSYLLLRSRLLSSSPFRVLFFFLFFLHPIFGHDDRSRWSSEFMRFLDADRGSRIAGMAELKDYFRRFGYLDNNTSRNEFFDDQLETALLSYQRNLGLSETGRLDYETMRSIVSPRCGVADSGAMTTMTSRRYAFFSGEPRWIRTPLTLSYAFSPVDTITYIDAAAMKAAFERAFSRWSEVIPLNFTETEDYTFADIRIGWYGGDHGDGEPFDGVLGVLAHAFSPETGRLHLDAAEVWAVDFSSEKSKVAVDLESVATHEIGHILGLGHSSAKEAVMYPSLSPRTRKLDLRIDDVEGIQALYGSNPNYRIGSRVASDISKGGETTMLTWARSVTGVTVGVGCFVIIIIAS